MLNQDEELRFCKARRAAIALDFQNLNPEQRKAAMAPPGGGGQRQDHRAHPPHRQPDEIRPGLRLRRGAGLGHPRRPGLPGGVCPQPRSLPKGGAGAALPGGSGGALVHHRHHLHQQGRRGAEGTAGADAGPGGGRHLGLHLPLRLRAHPAAGHRPAGLHQLLHYLRHRRLRAGDQGHPEGLQPG